MFLVFHRCCVSIRNYTETIRIVNSFSTDVILGIEYFQTGDFLWCAATFSIIFISGYTIAFYSFFKSEEFKKDDKRKVVGGNLGLTVPGCEKCNLGLTVPGYEYCNLGLQSQVALSKNAVTWDCSPRLQYS